MGSYGHCWGFHAPIDVKPASGGFHGMAGGRGPPTLPQQMIFGKDSDPRKIVAYPRYEDEPEVECPKCWKAIKLGHIPFQNGCGTATSRYRGCGLEK